MSEDTVTIVLDRREMAARGRVGGLVTASRHDMSVIARRAREGNDAKFLREADGDPARADVLRRLHSARMNLAKKIKARRKARRKVASDAA